MSGYNYHIRAFKFAQIFVADTTIQLNYLYVFIKLFLDHEVCYTFLDTEDLYRNMIKITHIIYMY